MVPTWDLIIQFENHSLVHLCHIIEWRKKNSQRLINLPRSFSQSVVAEFMFPKYAQNRIVSKILTKSDRYKTNQILYLNRYTGVSQVALVVKSPSASTGDIKRCKFNPWVREIPWRRKWQPTPVFLPGESHHKRNMTGYSPWDHKRVKHNWRVLA